MPVHSGTPDDKLLREVCRPKGSVSSTSTGASTSSSTNPSIAQSMASNTQVVEKAGEAAVGLRQHNQALIAREIQKEARRSQKLSTGEFSGKRNSTEQKQANTTESNVGWSYEGNVGPENWSNLKPEYTACASGRRQSPIDIRDGIALDLEPIQFAYRPSSFRVIDSGKSILLLTYGGSMRLLGKSYVLTEIQFHRPAEMSIAGRTFAMDAQLTHRADDGQVVILSVLLEKGAENPVLQMALNNFPLEKGGDVAPTAQNIDVERLLPEDRHYFIFMGSLTSPPCTEGVIWIVLKQPQYVSPEQLAIFERLYKLNARPAQPGWGRIIKESR